MNNFFKHKTIHIDKTKVNSNIIFFIGMAVFLSAMYNMTDFCAGITKGLANFANIILPSMFPFMLSSQIICSGEIPNKIKKIVEPITEKLFSLPCECAIPVFLSLIGGYPVGAKLISVLYNNKKITEKDAERMLMFCFAPGMGFCITAVGGSMLNSLSAGKLIFASTVTVSVLTGIITSLFSNRKKDYKDLNKDKTNDHHSISETIINSFSSCSQSAIMICAFVSFFSGFCEVISKLNIGYTVKTGIYAIAEVTNGCVALCAGASLPFICAVCSFGGLCIHMQILSIVKGIRISYLKFFISRSVQSVASYFSCILLLKKFPIETTVYAVQTNAKIVSFSYPASVSLIFLSLLLILDLEPIRKM